MTRTKHLHFKLSEYILAEKCFNAIFFFWQ